MGALIVLSASALAQASDDCANAPLLAIVPGQAGTSGYGNTSNATLDGACSCATAATGPDVWYRFTPSSDGDVRAYTATTGGSDWIISLHTGCPGTTANEIACNDVSPFAAPGSARVDATLAAGQTYWLRIAGANGTAGQFTLAFEFPTATWPLHDDPSLAVAICPGLHPGDNLAADQSDSLACISTVGKGVWYRYVPLTSGNAIVYTCLQAPGPTALFDTILAVFDGTTALACSDDACQWLSSLGFGVQAGREYWIRVSDYWSAGGTFLLTLAGPPAAENACGSLPPLKDGLQLVSLNHALADGVSACDAGTEPDLAYAYTAPTSGTLSVTTCGTDDIAGLDLGEDTVVSVHSDCPATAANTIACNDNTSPGCTGDAGVPADAALETAVVAGQQVVVRVTRAGPHSSDEPVLLTATFRPGIPFCAGDGSASACPCGNPGSTGHGCGHSQAAGARLQASGDPSVSADTLALHAANTPPSATGLYIQGTTKASGGAGVLFGDGLRCVSGVIVRLGFRASTNGASSFGHADGASVSAQGHVPAIGGTRHYQLWFRDAAPFCTSATFNLTNGLSILWRP